MQVCHDTHGDASRANVVQDISDTQCGGDGDVHDCNFEILNDVLVKILDKERVDANATNDFTVFVIAHGIDDVRHLLTMSEEDFSSVGHDIDFKTFCVSQTLNKMCNEDITAKTDKSNESL